MNENVTARCRVSIVMPVYNEARTVEYAIRRLRTVPLNMELICIDDGSRDGTRDVLARLHEEGVIDNLILQERNQGKGAAVRRGIQAATGDVTVIQDADLEYDPFDLPALLGPILDNRADVVFGSRFLGGPHRVLYFWHSVGNGLLTLISNMFTDLNLTDMETCYKMARTGLLKSLPLKTDRFGIEPELTARFSQAQARIYEVPISYNGRTYAEGKKINWKDGVAAFWHIFRSNVLDRKAEPYDRAIESGHGEHAGAHARVSAIGEGRDAGVPPGNDAAGERWAAGRRHRDDGVGARADRTDARRTDADMDAPVTSAGGDGAGHTR
ncbi:MAG TPA: glycosyltransferase family 2 protein [Longimicrobiales bacterium]|nr:glycosyltransferase family 2 protein [Longimicrobiales bacterium]